MTKHEAQLQITRLAGQLAEAQKQAARALVEASARVAELTEEVALLNAEVNRLTIMGAVAPTKRAKTKPALVD